MRQAKWLALRGLIALLGLVGAPLLMAESGSPALLERLTLDDGYLAWDGLRLGMSLVQAERKLGVTLALDRNREQSCPTWTASADFHGQSVTVGFAAPKPGAKIQWMRIGFRGALVQAGADEMVAALHARVPSAVWVPPAEPAGIVEGDDLQPDYAVEGKEPLAIRLAPREWIVLAARSCMG